MGAPCCRWREPANLDHSDSTALVDVPGSPAPCGVKGGIDLHQRTASSSNLSLSSGTKLLDVPPQAFWKASKVASIWTLAPSGSTT